MGSVIRFIVEELVSDVNQRSALSHIAPTNFKPQTTQTDTYIEYYQKFVTEPYHPQPPQFSDNVVYP